MGRDDFDGLDLFGDPIPRTRDKAGRPEHVWTQENSHKINLIFAIGGTPREAAQVLGISMPTLRKHYFSELADRRTARLRLKAKKLLRLHELGEAGSVPAIKEIFKQMDKGALAALSEAVANRGRQQPQAAPKPRPLGKKEEQKQAAGAVRGKFAPPPPPSLLN